MGDTPSDKESSEDWAKALGDLLTELSDADSGQQVTESMVSNADKARKGLRGKGGLLGGVLIPGIM
ncbi:hypothetical protein [Streptomyces flavalbus]|uniref:PH domain-containing protein n=1 Tax=Streptomyces flavalbus TaxID=2665155 RepID=A0ABW2WE76_9ACTN